VPVGLDKNSNINATFQSFRIKTNQKRYIYFKSSRFACYIFLCRTNVSCNHFGTAINVLNREILSAQEISLKEKGKLLIPSRRHL